VLATNRAAHYVPLVSNVRLSNFLARESAMKRVLLTCSILLASSQSYADWAGGVQLSEVTANPDGSVNVGLTTQPANTCSCWGWYFRFDASTPGGKNMLATILSAKMAGKAINVWYSVSSSPGTNQTNGCAGNAVSVLQGVSVA